MPVVAALDYHHTLIVVRMRHNTINKERKMCLVIQEINSLVTQCYAPPTAYTRGTHYSCNTTEQRSLLYFLCRDLTMKFLFL